MKYIDAELLQKEIERQIMGIIKKQDANPDIPKHRWYLYEGMKEAFNGIGGFIDSLQKEQQEKKEVKFVFPKFLYARTTNNKTIDVSYAPQSLDAIEYIRSDSLQQEQPVSDCNDLEEEIETYFKGWYMDETDQGYILHTPDDHAGLMSVKQVARHFAEWAASYLRYTTKMMGDELEEIAENIYKVPFGTRAEDFKAGAEWQKKQFEKKES